MPSAIGTSGLFAPSIVGRPGEQRLLSRPGAPGGRPGSAAWPIFRPMGVGSYAIRGVSRDVQGNPLGDCTVILFQTGNDAIYGRVVSDAAGVFSFSVPNTTTRFYAVFYRPGPPIDVAGTTVNTLVGS